MAKTTPPQPQPSVRWINPDGTPSLVFFQYMKALDGLLGPLINAANDGAAATAGVPVGAFYRNGSVVQIRVT